MLDLFGKGLTLLATFGQDHEGSMVRLMSTEYKRDYLEMINNGIMVNEDIATKFIKSQRDNHQNH